MQPNWQIHTFGCKVNTYDSGLIESALSKFEPGQTQVHILNTCAVTAEATKEALKLVRKIKEKDPESKIVVTGCGAQVDTEQFERLDGVDLVVANSHKSELPTLLNRLMTEEQLPKVWKSNIFKKIDLEAGGGLESHHTRAFLKIQDGCNSFCSFCIIPFARGLSRSIPITDLVKQMNLLYEQGYREAVLTGVHIGDYEAEGLVLEDLLEAVLNETQFQRIRLTSLEPIELTDRLLALYSDKRLCPHFHMSIQSAETDVLKQMKRKYTAEQVRNSLFKINSLVPNAFVGMDVIAGFPTETEEQFLATFQLLSETPWTRLHVFPYSERNGTKAALLPQIEWSVRKARARRLRELSDSRFQLMAEKQIGVRKNILVHQNAEGLKVNSNENGLILKTGISEDYWPVEIVGPSANLDQISVIIDEIKINLETGRFSGTLRGHHVS